MGCLLIHSILQYSSLIFTCSRLGSRKVLKTISFKEHCYIHFTALIFWVHCESAYTHWLEERKAVTDEVNVLTMCVLLLNSFLQVQRATTQFMDNISTVEPPNASTLNFQQPKLVQISVNDVGACIPLVPMVRVFII